MFKINDYLKTIIMVLIIIKIAPTIIESLKDKWDNNLQPHNKVGYLVINDTIDNTSYYRKYLTEFFKDASIKAILLKIESGGGAAGSCQALAFDIESLKKEFPKPIITYTENICASGAYEIAAATDSIVATGSAIIGSIGARLSPIFQLQDLLKQYNITCEEIAAGSCKNALSSWNKLTEEQKQMLQGLAENTYLQFAKEIAHKRHLQMNKIEQWGGGKLFTGQQAYDLKLVDALGSKSTAINLIKKNIIPSDRQIEWITVPAPSQFAFLFGSDEQDQDCDIVETSMWNNFFAAFFKQLKRNLQ